MSADAAITTLANTLKYPANKLILGVPSYGIMISTPTNATGSNMEKNKNIIKGTWDDESKPLTWSGSFDYDHLMMLKNDTSSGFTHYYNAETAASTLWNADKGLFVSFDCKHAIQQKKIYSDANQLGGLFTWEVSMSRSDEVLDYMRGKKDELSPPRSITVGLGGSGPAATSSSQSGVETSIGSAQSSTTGAAATTDPASTQPASVVASTMETAATAGSTGGSSGMATDNAAGQTTSPTTVALAAALPTTGPVNSGASFSSTSGTSGTCTPGTRRCASKNVEICSAEQWVPDAGSCDDTCATAGAFTCVNGDWSQCANGKHSPRTNVNCQLIIDLFIYAGAPANIGTGMCVA